MATSPSPYPADPLLLGRNHFEQQWLKLQMQEAAAQSWEAACSISQRLLREPYPPEDLWERAIQRTASVLLEGQQKSIDAAQLLLRHFEVVSRNRKRAQNATIPMSDSAGSFCIEDAVVAQLDLKKIMSSLDPKDRELLLLRFMAGRSWVEIAEMKGQSKHALRKRCARIVEQLRRRFGTGLNPK